MRQVFWKTKQSVFTRKAGRQTHVIRTTKRVPIVLPLVVTDPLGYVKEISVAHGLVTDGIAFKFVAGSGVTLTPDASAKTLTITATGGGGGGGTWGTITGTLSDQTDLQAALNAKATPADIAAAISAHTGEADPHPQYLTATEGNAAYAPLTHTDTATIDFTVGAAVTASARFQMSLTADAGGLKLAGDATSPGLNYYYGTDSAGAKGWLQFPTSTVEAIWRYSTAIDTTIDPGAGKVRTNTVSFMTATFMSISRFTDGGLDFAETLRIVTTDDIITLQDKTNAANWIRYRVTMHGTDNLTWFRFSVVGVEAGGTIPTNNSQVLIKFSGSGGAGGGFQPLDPTLTALAGLTIVANSLLVGTAADAFAVVAFAANTFPARASAGNIVPKTISDFGLALIDDANAAAAHVTLGLRIGIDVQAYDVDLFAIANFTNTNALIYRQSEGLWNPVGIGAGLSFIGGTLAATGSSGAVNFIGALLRTNTSKAIASVVSWDAATYDTSGFWSAGNPTRITIPSGVTKVRLSGCVEIAASATGSRAAGIIKNGATYFGGGATVWSSVTYDNPTATFHGPVLDVVAGDYFELFTFSSQAGLSTISANGRTWFAVEVIQGISGTSYHGALSGLANDDHLQYHNDTRGDARYQPLDADLTALAALAGTNTIYYRSGANTWGAVVIGANLTFTGGTLAATGGGGGGISTVTDTTSVNLTIAGSDLSAAAIVASVGSIDIGSTGLKLKGEHPTIPPASTGTPRYYGMDAADVRGWYDLPSGGTAYTNEMAQDAVGGILVDSTSINFTYDDGAGFITAAAIVQNSIELAAAGGAIQLANDLGTPGASKLYGTDASGVKGWHAQPAGGGGAGTVAPSVCEGRLTTESGVPVSSADRSSQATIYFTPYKGARVALYDGSAWVLHDFTEVSLTLSGMTGNQNYDVFIYNNAGTLTLERSAAWTNDTTRSEAITQVNGIYVKSGATTRRYLGTFRSLGADRTDDTQAKRNLWNYYNRVPRPVLAFDATTSWAYSLAVWRQKNGSAVNEIRVVAGLEESFIMLKNSAAATVAGGTTSGVYCAIGRDATTAPTPAEQVWGAAGISPGMVVTPVAHFEEIVPIGYHYYAALERGHGSNTQTWYGTTPAAFLRTALIGSYLC